MKTRAHACSQQGTGSAQNQDLWFIDDSLGLYAVADGVGERGLGLQAAKIAVQAMVDVVEDAEPDAKRAGVVRSAMMAANTAVFEAAQQSGHLRQMTCSLTVALVDGDTFVLGQLGDTRAFLANNGVAALTRENTLRAELVEAGRLTEKNSWTDKSRFIVTKAVGLFSAAEPRVNSFPVSRGDRILLLSGATYRDAKDAASLWGRVAGKSANASAKALVEAASSKREFDDRTALVIEVDGELPEQRPGLDFLRAHPAFADLSLRQLVWMHGIGRRIKLHGASLLADQGEMLSTMFVVLDGSLVITDAESRSSHGAGAVVGYSRLLWDGRAKGTVEAESGAELLAFSRQDFQKLARRHHWLGLRVLLGLGAYIAAHPDPV